MSQEFVYYTKGTCSREMHIQVNDNVIENVEVIGGCNGNLKGITSLVKGMKVDDVIAKLEGIECGVRKTSCPDQLAKALIEYKNQ